MLFILFSTDISIHVFYFKATEDNSKMGADDAATLLANGGGEDVLEEATQSSDNSPALSSEHPVKKSEDGPDVPVLEEEFDPISKLAMCEEEEAEGTLVIRAERVVVTEEGNEVHEDLVALPDQLQVLQSEEAVTSSADEGQDVVVMEGIRTEMSTQGDDHDNGAKHTLEKGLQDFTDTRTDSPDKASGSTSLQTQPSPGDAEAAALCPVPVYGESTLNPELPLEATAAEVLPEESEAAVKTQDPVPAAGHFQDVPLAEPREQQPEEQEPLLSHSTAPDICSEAEAAVSVTCSQDAQSAPRAGQGEDTQAPKHKSCQCCSVM